MNYSSIVLISNVGQYHCFRKEQLSYSRQSLVLGYLHKIGEGAKVAC